MYGSPEYDQITDRWKCEICGGWYEQIQTHLRVHDMNMEEYKEKFGFDKTTTLMSDMLLLKKRKYAIENNIVDRIKEEGKKHEFKPGHKLSAKPRREEMSRHLRAMSSKANLTQAKKKRGKLQARRERLYKLMKAKDERVQNK